MARVELGSEAATVRDEGVLPRRPVEAAGPEGGEPALGIHGVSRGGERGTPRLAGSPGAWAASA